MIIVTTAGAQSIQASRRSSRVRSVSLFLAGPVLEGLERPWLPSEDLPFRRLVQAVLELADDVARLDLALRVEGLLDRREMSA